MTLWLNNNINKIFVITILNMLTIFYKVFFIQDIKSIERVHNYKFHGLKISEKS